MRELIRNLEDMHTVLLSSHNLAALDVRIDEFTALLDVLTGGWFSKQSK